MDSSRLAHPHCRGSGSLFESCPGLGSTSSRYLEEANRHSLEVLDFTDDRLQAVLRYLNHDEQWLLYEQAQGQHIIKVYNLPQEVVRLDTTTASTYQEENPDGLLRQGVSKDHRPDLAQLKVMLGTLDPLGMPLATQVVSGNRADDPLYIPAIEQIRRVLNQTGVLYVGDSKMAALGTRYAIHSQDDHYLTPLPATIVPDSLLDSYLEPLWDEAQKIPLTPVYKEDTKGKPRLIAEGFEFVEPITIALFDEETDTWNERRRSIRASCDSLR